MKIQDIIKKCKLSSEEQLIFKDYLANHFIEQEKSVEQEKNVEHEKNIERWKRIVGYAEKYDSAQAVNKFVAMGKPVDFIDPAGVRIELFDSFAGKLPLIYVKNTEDFESLAANVVYKGVRPETLLYTGALFVFGKSMRFILLSAKPYSNIPASETGLSEKEWAEKSMIIRREHECTHYFTRMYFGIARNHLHDELIADFFGLYEAFGEYKREYFLKFMRGMRDGKGRLQIYAAHMSDGLYKAVSEVAFFASEGLEQYSRSERFLAMSREQQVLKLCRTGLAQMCLAEPAAYRNRMNRRYQGA